MRAANGARTCGAGAGGPVTYNRRVFRLQNDDRRDLAQWALTVAVFGLVVAPAVHLGWVHSNATLPHALRVFVHHADDPGEVPLSPEAPEDAGHSHALGGAEHLQLSVDAPVVARFESIDQGADVERWPAAPEDAPRRVRQTPAMPQGP